MERRELSNRELLITNNVIFGYIPKMINFKEFKRLNEYAVRNEIEIKDDNLFERLYFGLDIMQDRGCWVKNDWSVYRGINGKGAHRVSFSLFRLKGAPNPLLICHYCDRPGCVNFLHLFQGTTTDNRNDSVLKGRQSDLRFLKRKNKIDPELREKYKWSKLARFCK